MLYDVGRLKSELLTTRSCFGINTELSWVTKISWGYFRRIIALIYSSHRCILGILSTYLMHIHSDVLVNLIPLNPLSPHRNVISFLFLLDHNGQTEDWSQVNRRFSCGDKAFFRQRILIMRATILIRVKCFEMFNIRERQGQNMTRS